MHDNHFFLLFTKFSKTRNTALLKELIYKISPSVS